MKEFTYLLKCENCGETSLVDESCFLPGKQVVGYGYGCIDEFLIWNVWCPCCNNFGKELSQDFIMPNDLKLELLNKYSGIAEETKTLWIRQAELIIAQKNLEKAMNNIIEKSKQIDYKKEKSLFDEWKPNIHFIDSGNRNKKISLNNDEVKELDYKVKRKTFF